MAKRSKGPKGINPRGMMQQLQELQNQVLAAQEQLKKDAVVGTSGGGAVKVTVTGDQRCTAVEIDPEFLQDIDVEMLQDMVLSALNNALDASRTLAEERLGPLSTGLPF